MFGKSNFEHFTDMVTLVVGITSISFVLIVFFLVFGSTRTAKFSNKKKTDFEYDVFLSYASNDKRRAKNLAEKLAAAGLKVFFADKDLKAGIEFSENIREALVASRELWLLATPTSIESTWVTTEWGTAWGLEKPIVPVLFEISPEQMPDRLRTFHNVDYSKVGNEIENATLRIAAPPQSPKRFIIVVLCCLLFGALGAHRFYVGKWKTASLQLAASVTSLAVQLPLLALAWPVIDLVLMGMRKFSDANDRPLSA